MFYNGKQYAVMVIKSVPKYGQAACSDCDLQEECAEVSETGNVLCKPLMDERRKQKLHTMNFVLKEVK